MQQRAIADHYQDFVAGTPLCELDQQFLESHFPDQNNLVDFTNRPLVIDFGCGDGRSLLPLAQRGYRTLGIDLSESMLDCAQQRMGNLLQPRPTDPSGDPAQQVGPHPASSDPSHESAPMTSRPGQADIGPSPVDEMDDKTQSMETPDGQVNHAVGASANCLWAHWVRANLVQLDCLAEDIADHGICLFSTLGMIQGREHRRRFLQHARRIIRPGGSFVLHVHNVWSALSEPGGKRRLLHSWWKSFRRTDDHEFGDHVYAYRGLANMFLHRFRERELASDLRTGGWNIQSVHPIHLSGTSFVNPNRWRPDLVGGFLVVAS